MSTKIYAFIMGVNRKAKALKTKAGGIKADVTVDGSDADDISKGFGVLASTYGDIQAGDINTAYMITEIAKHMNNVNFKAAKDDNDLLRMFEHNMSSGNGKIYEDVQKHVLPSVGDNIFVIGIRSNKVIFAKVNTDNDIEDIEIKSDSVNPVTGVTYKVTNSNVTKSLDIVISKSAAVQQFINSVSKFTSGLDNALVDGVRNMNNAGADKVTTKAVIKIVKTTISMMREQIMTYIAINRMLVAGFAKEISYALAKQSSVKK